jgi:hypothetical protein
MPSLRILKIIPPQGHELFPSAFGLLDRGSITTCCDYEKEVDTSEGANTVCSWRLGVHYLLVASVRTCNASTDVASRILCAHTRHYRARLAHRNTQRLHSARRQRRERACVGCALENADRSL